MALEFTICEVKWDRYPRVSENTHGREWLKFQATRGLAANTIEAYGRDLDCYLGFLGTRNIPFDSVIMSEGKIPRRDAPRLSRPIRLLRFSRSVVWRRKEQ